LGTESSTILLGSCSSSLNYAGPNVVDEEVFMSSLVIDHGNPPWLSPNVWVVPTSNPNEASPGEVAPVVGSQYYAVANVRNTSESLVLNATVYFWWADPALRVITSVNAHLIGTSSVSVLGNASNTSLELTPWTPSFVNRGHECVIAAVVEGGGPPPNILDGANDPTVAQRNLGVVKTGAMKKWRFAYPFQVCNPSRLEQSFSIHARKAPIEQAAPLLKQNVEVYARALKLGFVKAICPESEDFEHAKPVLEDIRLAPFACTGFTLAGVLEEGQALIHVTQEIGNKIVGGLSVLVISEKEH
jgi:hypothetical protein